MAYQQAIAPDRRRMVLLTAVTVLVCVPIVAAAQYLSQIRSDEHDAWLFAYYGQQLLEGRELYAEVWDNKPPGIFWVNAIGLWLSGGSIAGPITMCALASAGACALAFALGSRLYGRATGAIAAVLASVYLFVAYYHVGCNRPSTFFVVTEFAAVLLYVRSFPPSKRPRLILLAAGFCAGLSLCFKQTGLAAAVGIGVHLLYLIASQRDGWRLHVRRLALFAGGLASAIGCTVVLLALTSDLGWAWHAIVAFNQSYFVPGVGAQWWPHWFGQPYHARTLALPIILALATVVHPLARWLWGWKSLQLVDVPGCRPPGLLFLLWVWLLAGVYLALLGPHQRMAYWGIALPPLVMLATHGVYLLLNSGRVSGMERPTFHVVVIVLWGMYMLATPLGIQVQEIARQRWLTRYDERTEPFDASVAAIRATCSEEEALFVWDYNPKLYWASGRRSAIRYIATEKAWQLGSRGQALMDEIVALLKSARPKVIVVNPRHVAPRASTAVNGTLDLEGFREWLRTDYEQPEQYKKHHMWIRKT